MSLVILSVMKVKVLAVKEVKGTAKIGKKLISTLLCFLRAGVAKWSVQRKMGKVKRGWNWCLVKVKARKMCTRRCPLVTLVAVPINLMVPQFMCWKFLKN